VPQLLIYVIAGRRRLEAQCPQLIVSELFTNDGGSAVQLKLHHSPQCEEAALVPLSVKHWSINGTEADRPSRWIPTELLQLYSVR